MATDDDSAGAALPAFLRDAPEVPLSDYRAWFGMEGKGDSAVQEIIERALRGLAGLIPFDPGWIKGLTTLNGGEGDDDRCFRDCPPQKPATIRRESYGSGVYLICRHDPRHAIKVRL